MTKFFQGYYEVRVTGAAPERCINRFAAQGIPFWDLELCSELELRCKIFRQDQQLAEQAALRAMCTLEVEKEYGFHAVFYGVLRRPALLLGLTLAVVGALFAQSFVWTIRVEGNEQIPAETILRELDDLGVRFGAWGPDIDTQEMKNEMLNKVPALSWLAVNRSGGCLTVLVTEREESPPTLERTGVANVVAKRAGIITSMRVLNGFAAVAPGDAVLSGQLLISGLADWTTHTQVTRAIGEIYALTMHSQAVKTPLQYGKKVYTGREHTQVSLVLGRKRIKISGNSGIFYTSCDKMVDRRVCALPGGYEFPAVLEIATYREYTVEPTALTKQEAEKMLTQFVRDYVQGQMVAGTILEEACAITKESDGYLLTAGLSCEEMISVTIPVNIIGDDVIDGEND